MRIRVAPALAGTAAVSLSCTAVWAATATPRPGALFSGTGSEYFNNGASGWVRAAAVPFSFKISRHGGAIVDFRGHYSYYCGAGSSTLTAYGPIRSDRRFAIHFHERVRYGISYGDVKGRFNAAGTRASVSYLFDFVASGTTVGKPFDTRDPHALGCATWVRGAASAGPRRSSTGRA
jgi:hypothetical protein